MIVSKPVTVYDSQMTALRKMHNGCILCSKVGSGKSRTGLAYYYILNGGKVNSKEYVHMKDPKDLYIITTATKRNKKEWDDELMVYGLSQDPKSSLYSNTVKVDSWNNIKKYKGIKNAFFIFDEQKASGTGPWAKTFISLAKTNQWIMLSATPGDNWSQYVPVFLAHGFFKSQTEFERMHAVFNRYVSYKSITGYYNEGILLKYKYRLLVDMDGVKQHERVNKRIECDYDKKKYKELIKTRWDPYDDCPIETAPKFCYLMRKIVNSDDSRLEHLKSIQKIHKKLIVFYNYDYELEKMLGGDFGENVTIGQLNGHKHDPLPCTDEWIYLVQYNSGAEGWNCIETNAMIFYSQSYSYKTMEQASGRIDRATSPYDTLYYYHFRSFSGIDIAIAKTLEAKKEFNERKYINSHFLQ